MQTPSRRFAHVLERCGLALAGAACGLFVAAHVGSSISFLTTQGFLLIMMIVGGIGFYLASIRRRCPSTTRNWPSPRWTRWNS